MIAFFLFAMASAAIGTNSHTASPTFPIKYRGDWFVASKSCDAAEVSIRVEESSIDYFDEFAMRKILKINRKDSNSLRLLAEYGAEGHRWNERVLLQFSPDQRNLTVTRNSVSDKTLSETVRYQRCDVTKKSS